MRLAVTPIALTFFALAVAGCGPGGAWIVAVFALVLVIVGCSESHSAQPDAEVRGADAELGGEDGGGTWSPCCVSGRVSSCYCPAMTACNYGLGTIFCDDGETCGIGSDPAEVCGADAGPADAGPPDAAGSWEPCCIDGRISTCFCPAGAACNYGWYTDCGGGTCGYTPDQCSNSDAGSVLDAG